MNILLTNDDGIDAKGLLSLAQSLQDQGHSITIVAPAEERSASSHSLTLRKDIIVKKIDNQKYSVSGTPVDCVVIAIQKLIKQPIDLVISGINAGQNMGEDILYSGTVAAAVEAAMFGYPAIAVSINAYRDQVYSTASQWIAKFIQKDILEIINKGEVFNINVPNIPYDEIKGIRLASVGHRKYYNFIKVISEASDSFTYRIGGDQPVWDISKGTDAEAVRDGYISITPLIFELTNGNAYPKILQWIEISGLL